MDDLVVLLNFRCISAQYDDAAAPMTLILVLLRYVTAQTHMCQHDEIPVTEISGAQGNNDPQNFGMTSSFESWG